MLTASVNGKEYKVYVYVEDISVSAEGLTGKKNSYKISVKPGSETAISFKMLYQPAVFKSSKPEVAYIDVDGTLKARKAGKTTITTKLNGKTVKIKVTVKD